MKKTIAIFIFLPCILFAQQTGYSSNRSGYNVTASLYSGYYTDTPGTQYDPDAEAYFTRSGVSDTAVFWKAGVNAYIIALKGYSLYSDIAAFWIHAAPDTTTALTNVISSSFTAFTVSAPAFTVFEGFAGDGAADYINYNFNLSTDGGSIYTQNDAGFSLYQRVAAPTNAKWWCGVFIAPNSTYLLPSGGNILFDCNNNSGDGSDANATRAANWTISRQNSTNVLLYMNGSLAENDAVTSSAPLNLKFYGLCLNANGTAAAFSNCQISITAIHGGFDATQAANFNTATEQFMDYLGKGVQ